MKNLLFGFIIYIFLILFNNQADAIMIPPPGTNTPPATNTTPYILSVKCIPKDGTMTVGSQGMFRIFILWSDGNQYPYTVTYSCNIGSITTKGNLGFFSSTKSGTAIIKAQVNGFEDMGRIKISPGILKKIALSYTKPLLYGMIYPKNIFIIKGYDRYDNEVVLNKIEYKLRKKMATHLSEWIGETPNSNLNKTIKAGVVVNGNLLFFDVGEYEMEVTANAQSTIFSIMVEFDGYDNSIAWKDYRVIDIDFDKGEFIVEYAFEGYPTIRSNFIVKDEWIKQFKEGDIIQKIQILTWLHYKILAERTKVLKEMEYEQFKNLLLKPLEGKFQQ
ncbi:MAG: hypothetical protein ACOYWZ_16070 [Bacillota bacterium]